MELIPILSTIILVATICTFLLAIGAYILYKIRERKGEPVPYPKPSSVRAELVTPDEREYEPEQYLRPEKMHAPFEPHYVRTSTGAGIYARGQEYQRPQQKYYPVEEQEISSTGRVRTKKKFLKYTTEGYIPTEEDKNTGVLKWR
ncbi:MAG TPA: hypothetical protein VLB50_14120 [Ignavibacteriaceae bacterium]|nr:hypothetical protein [Ignavibacteriaceae bacterium]